MPLTYRYSSSWHSLNSSLSQFSSSDESEQSRSTSPTSDLSAMPQASSNTADPHLHSTPLTSADFSGNFHKSPEYMGEYATTTKPEDRPVRPHVRDLFNIASRASDDKQENENETVPEESLSRL